MFAWLALVTALLSTPAAARSVHAREWTVNAWGEMPPRIEQTWRDARCHVAGDDGAIFHMIEKRRGEAEMVLPGALRSMIAYEFSAKVRKLGAQPGSVPIDVFFRKDAPHYQTAVIRTVKATTEWQSFSVKGVFFLEGEGSVRIAVPQGGGPVCVAQATLKEIPADEVGAPTTAFRVGPRLFGVHINKLGSHNSWPAFDPGVVRLWDSGTTWADLQPQDAPIDWIGNAAAIRLQYYRKHVRRFGGNDAELMMTLGMTPRWAASPGGCGPAPYGASSCLPPRSRADWRRHVADLAQRYRGQIRLWEVWNEADIGYHWAGDLGTLVGLLKDAREELKEADPDNIVIGPNVTINGLRMLQDMLNLGAGRYMDGLSFHSYFGRTPRIALASIRNLRQMMSYHGLDLPLWNTEVGTGCDLAPTCASLRSPTSYRDGLAAIAQGLIGEAAMGVVNTNYHTWEGGAVQTGHLPLVEGDYRTETEAGALYRRLRALLVGRSVRWLGELPGGGGGVVEVSATGKPTCWIAWGEDEAQLVPMDRVKATSSWVSVDGSRSIPATGKSSVPVGRMPAMACAS